MAGPKLPAWDALLDRTTGVTVGACPPVPGSQRRAPFLSGDGFQRAVPQRNPPCEHSRRQNSAVR